MRIALTGVSGFIGSFIARHLATAGHQVTGLVRETSRRDHIEDVVDRFVIGDQADETAWPDLLKGADCVIHNALDWRPLRDRNLDEHLHANLLAPIRLLHSSAPRQFIFISSIAVHHDMRPRFNGDIDEDHPTRPGTLYGACKAAIEAHLWAAHFENHQHISAFRPCAVYGIDPTIDRSIGYPIIELIKRNHRYRKQGGGKFVHVDDVASAVTAAVDNPNANAKIYNLADCYARWGDLATIAAGLLGVDAEVDLSSPAQPQNTFTKDAAQSLGVKMDRGHDGINQHLRNLIDLMD